MKQVSLILLILSCRLMLSAQTALLLPYDATTLTDEQKSQNPDRLAYPTAMKENIKQDMYFQCNAQREELGPFSVSPTKKVVFSPGNLQYNAAKGSHQCADGTTQLGTWRFAEHQWDYVAGETKGTVFENGVKSDNEKRGIAYNGWIDLFAWGTSGWNSGANAYQPYSARGENTDYCPGGSYMNDLTGTYSMADWGVYNAIQNGSSIDPAGTWRTLTKEEWVYLFSGRTNAKNLFGLGIVNGVNGMIVLPDNWECPSGVTFEASTTKGLVWTSNEYGAYYIDVNNKNHYLDNTYTIEEWDRMEHSGVVFLPEASVECDNLFFGYGMIDTIGQYWSTTHHIKGGAEDILFLKNHFPLIEEYTAGGSRGAVRSVRLVRDIPNTFSVSASTKVVFSPGNLQYNAAKDSHQCADGTTQPGTWRFAEHQWDYVGGETEGTVYENEIKSDNEKRGIAYDGWIDLFAWGTSGWNSGANVYLPYIASEPATDYYPGGYYKNDLTGEYAFSDWGFYNAIQNRQDTDSYATWRTLTANEWSYLLVNRAYAEKLFGLGTVNGVCGLIILPDNWQLPTGVSFCNSTSKGLIWNSKYLSYRNTTNVDYSHYLDNIYNISQWNIMESAGAVFLPAAGTYSSRVGYNEGAGNYWSSTHDDYKISDYEYSFELDFKRNILYPQNYKYYALRYGGRSVRLVRDIK